MLEVSNLNIGYGTPLLKNKFSASFTMGEIIVVLGSNGIGKSTFLKTIAGFIDPMEGKVTRRKELTIGWVDSHHPQIEYLTIENYLCFGINPEVEIVNKWLTAFELELALNTFIANISDGQFRKLAIIRQLLKDPDILILDEPTVYLDVHSKHLLAEELKQLVKSKLIFCSTHDLHFGEIVANRFLKIEEGEVILS